MFIQEHKIRHVNDQIFPSQIWKDGFFFTTIATDGMHTLRNPAVHVGKGGFRGIAIDISHAIDKMVLRVDTSPCGRAMMVCVDDPMGNSFGLMNVYGPHTTTERTSLWEYLLVNVDTTRPWLVGGDFNMTILASNQIGGIAVDLGGAEYAVWMVFANSINLIDAFLGDGSVLAYTWDNNHVDVSTKV